MRWYVVREKSSWSENLLLAPRDEKNRQVCLISDKEIK
jgi:hypothetical protein